MGSSNFGISKQKPFEKPFFIWTIFHFGRVTAIFLGSPCKGSATGPVEWLVLWQHLHLRLLTALRMIFGKTWSVFPWKIDMKPTAITHFFKGKMTFQSSDGVCSKLKISGFFWCFLKVCGVPRGVYQDSKQKISGCFWMRISADGIPNFGEANSDSWFWTYRNWKSKVTVYLKSHTKSNKNSNHCNLIRLAKGSMKT